MQTWAAVGRPVRQIEQRVAPDDPAPKALAGYGLSLPAAGEGLLRFVDGRPGSGGTTQCLAWGRERLAARGTAALLLGWDNAGWHISKEVRRWLRAHHQRVTRTGQGGRILSCLLPSHRPWVTPLEPTWRHRQRRVHEPDRLLTTHEMADRVWAALRCPAEEHLPLPKKVA